MTLRDDTDQHFLTDVQSWLDQAMADLRGDFAEWQFPHEACRRRWNAMLCAADLVALTWPRQLGGRALSTAALVRFHEYCAKRGAPQPINSIAHSILAPTLLQYGDAGQLARFLPGIRAGTEIWCQGYSEPASGSDLASVRSRARRDGAGWIVDGHKIWTTQAHAAQWCFALIRTDPDSRGHRGLSFMLIGMQERGVRAEPIRQLTGESDFNEVFFEGVQVRADQIVGPVGEGWRIAMGAAEFERGVYFLPRVVRLEAELAEVRASLEHAMPSEPLRSRLVTELLRLSDACAVIRWRVDKVLERVAAGGTPGIDGAILKLLWSETRQAVMELRMEQLGERAVIGPAAGQRFPREAAATREFLWSRAETLVAGTSEIQRNIIAERLLGLPKDSHGTPT